MGGFWGIVVFKGFDLGGEDGGVEEVEFVDRSFEGFDLFLVFNFSIADSQVVGWICFIGFGLDIKISLEASAYCFKFTVNVVSDVGGDI